MTKKVMLCIDSERYNFMVIIKDIKAMKMADHICFRTQNDKSTIECFYENQYTPYHICNVTHKYKTSNIIGGFYHTSLYSWDFCPIKTMISLLKEGDTIKLVWDKNAGNTEDMVKNNFVSDYFYIEIHRKEKIKYNFLIHASTGRNNLGRMIKSKIPISK